MPKKTHQNIISLMSLTVLLAIVFSCEIGIWNSIFPVSSISGHHDMSSTADCCPSDNSASGTTIPGSDSSGSIFTLPDNRLFFIAISLLFLLVVFNFISRLANYAIYSYLKNIRIKYGGFKLFYYFSYLFSSGILNPKIY